MRHSATDFGSCFGWRKGWRKIFGLEPSEQPEPAEAAKPTEPSLASSQHQHPTSCAILCLNTTLHYTFPLPYLVLHLHLHLHLHSHSSNKKTFPSLFFLFFLPSTHLHFHLDLVPSASACHSCALLFALLPWSERSAVCSASVAVPAASASTSYLPHHPALHFDPAISRPCRCSFQLAIYLAYHLSVICNLKETDLCLVCLFLFLPCPHPPYSLLPKPLPPNLLAELELEFDLDFDTIEPYLDSLRPFFSSCATKYLPI